MDRIAPMTSLQAAICEHTAEACCQAFGPHLIAIVFTGSMARGEATHIDDDLGTRVLGDAEFFLVFEARTSLPSKTAVDPLTGEIERRLADRRVWCNLELTAVHPEYFRRLNPAIFAYELRACGQVVWGEPSVLSLIPAFSVAEIPREDAWRLLSNRIIECLEVAPDLLKAKGSEKFLYRLVKLYLDMATSFLVFVGDYRPTYRARDQALRQIAERNQGTAEFPLPLHMFSKQVTACTEFKLEGGREFPFIIADPDHRTDRVLWRDAVDYVRRLWRWELTQLTEEPSTSADRRLMERWMSFQPLSRRLRGWLVVLRECGWWRSYRHWPRWAGLARRASPRYWVYTAASELFFSLPDEVAPWLLGRHPSKGQWAQRTSTLPIILSATAQADSSEWVALARGIAANYHRFVEHTRS